MKRIILTKLVRLPRSFRVWWGTMFMWMLGDWKEVRDDIVLYNRLKEWVDAKGRPNTRNQ